MALADASILVTGGTGSFGNKFAEIVLARYRPRRLVIFSRDELKQSEMRARFNGDSRLRFFIGDIRDRERLVRAMYDVDVVVHAAALKQIPPCEYNPFEAIQTNVMGGKNVIDAAIDCGVKRVIALSTDKAVNPINLYGATKLCMEKLFVQGNAYGFPRGTRLACVRYGNVVGSRGSVIPLFLTQRSGGVLTVTDPQMTRFWITLEEGVEFVVRCLDRMRGGEIFVPKIASMHIMDLAQAVAPGCRTEFIGIRPGEKLHEVLISEDESRQGVELSDMFVIEPVAPAWGYEPWREGKPLPPGYRYASDSNDRFFGAAEMQALLDG
jgi:UDP-N-acetylglucosamine 4,6-dehydratase